MDFYVVVAKLLIVDRHVVNMRIIIAGDLFCGGDLLEEAASPDLIKIPEYFKADFRIVNLENPLSDRNEVADKCTIHAPTSAAKYLQAFNIDGVNLANNHIHDKGNEGINDTIDILDKYSIKHCGVGENIDEARNPIILEKDGEKVAIMGYCDFGRPYLKQVQIATETTPGVAPLRYEIILEDLNKLDHSVDKAILFFHWGIEHTWFPPQEDLFIAMKVLEHPKVDLVVGSHSHLPQGFVEHEGKKAYIGLGNFLFPNFFIQSPTQLVYPTEISDYDITQGYHSVSRLTHKRWPKWSRRSILVCTDTLDRSYNIVFSEQEYLRPIVRKVLPFSRYYILSNVYNNFNALYGLISDNWYAYIRAKRLVHNYYYYLRQNGVRKTSIKVYCIGSNYIKKRLDVL